MVFRALGDLGGFRGLGSWGLGVSGFRDLGFRGFGGLGIWGLGVSGFRDLGFRGFVCKV